MHDHRHPLSVAWRPALMLIAALLLAACDDPDAPRDLASDAPRDIEPVPPPPPPQTQRDRTEELLDAQAAVMKVQAPLQPMGIYLADLQLIKDDVDHQLVVHQYCAGLDADADTDRVQCAMFDGDSATARLIGTRYIISPTLYESLPQDQRSRWHPLNYEILSGLLVAPQLPEVAEMELMRRLLNHYALSWFVWDGNKTDAAEQELPHGTPQLGWSFNRNGEADPALMRQLAKATGVELIDEGRSRSELVALAKPQVGVDALEGEFEGETVELPGVVDRSESAANDAGEGSTSGQP